MKKRLGHLAPYFQKLDRVSRLAWFLIRAELGTEASPCVFDKIGKLEIITRELFFAHSFLKHKCVIPYPNS